MSDIEKLKGLSSEAKRGNHDAFDDFFEFLFAHMTTLPQDETFNTAKDLNIWARSNAEENPSGYAFTLFGLAFICYHNAVYDDGLKYNNEALRIFEELDNEDGIALCNGLFGGFYHTLGDISLAMKYMLFSYNYFKTHQRHPYFRCVSGYGLAEIYSSTGHYDQALDIHLQTLKFAEESGIEYAKALSLSGISGVYFRKKEFDKALEYVNKDLEYSDRINNMPHKSRVLTDLADYYQGMGDYDHALQYNRDALEIREKLNIPGAMITNMHHIGVIFWLTGKYDDAINILEKALALADKIKLKFKAYQVHLAMSEVYEQKGNLGQSLLHFKAFHNLRDEVNNEDEEKKVKYMQLIFEGEQSKKENAVIKAQKAEIEQKNKELQETIDELTITKISKRAKAITIFVAVVLLAGEDALMHFVIKPYIRENFLFTLLASGFILLLVKPIEKAIEHFLLRRLVIERRKVLAAVQSA